MPSEGLEPPVSWFVARCVSPLRQKGKQYFRSPPLGATTATVRGDGEISLHFLPTRGSLGPLLKCRGRTWGRTRDLHLVMVALIPTELCNQGGTDSNSTRASGGPDGTRTRSLLLDRELL